MDHACTCACLMDRKAKKVKKSPQFEPELSEDWTGCAWDACWGGGRLMGCADVCPISN